MEGTDSPGSLLIPPPPPPPPPPPQPNLPPGFRFHPTDEELVVHYLKRKADSIPLPVSIIADIDLYKFDPWELPAKACFGEQEWYFFSPRDRKYPNGARPNRAATSGYWKATGTDKPVISTTGDGGGGGKKKVGVKKALVFYGGKPPKGVKSDWIMHEYRLTDHHTNKPFNPYHFSHKKNSLRLDDWVLCRIYKKNTNTTTSRHLNNDHHDMMMMIPPPTISRTNFFPAIFSEDNDPAAMYDGGGNYSMNHILASSSGLKLFQPMMSLNQDPGIGSLSPSLSSKRFNGGVGECSMAAPPPLMQQQGGVLGEGLMRTSDQLTGLNWYG